MGFFFFLILILQRDFNFGERGKRELFPFFSIGYRSENIFATNCIGNVQFTQPHNILKKPPISQFIIDGTKNKQEKRRKRWAKLSFSHSMEKKGTLVLSPNNRNLLNEHLKPS